MPHYPSGYYGVSTNSNYNNVVTRRLAIKDRVGFAQSPRFGGQWMEPKGVPSPYNGTIIDAQGALAQLVQEINLISPIFPDLGTPVLLSGVGVATNVLTTANGVGVSVIGTQATANLAFGVSTTVANTLSFDAVGVSTGLRVLYYGLNTSSLNGVYTVGWAQTNGTGPNYFYLARSSDLQYWWQFTKPRAYVVTGGTTNKSNVFSLQTDGWELGNTFTIASGAVNGVAGTSIVFTNTSYTPGQPSGINTNLGPGAGTTSLINPIDFNPLTGIGTGEYGFLANASQAKFIHLKNRARRLCYQMFKLRENFTPFVSSYQTNVVSQIGLGNTQYNIGVSSANNLPASSRYPSSFNRGW